MHGLGVEPTPPMAEALYVGLITDTGRFMYENTGPRAHEMAAELIASGVDVQGGSTGGCTRTCRSAKLALLARALRNVTRFDDGALVFAYLTAGGLRRDGGRGELLRGHHRPAARGAGREGGCAQPRADRARIARAERKVSLRAVDDDVDVSAIARAQGGGGHRRAAGFSTDLEVEELVVFLRRAVAEQLGTAAGSPTPTAA